MSTQGAIQTPASSSPLALYRTIAADLRRCLDLGDIAAEYGHTGRAVEYLLGALEELAPELAELGHLRSS